MPAPRRTVEFLKAGVLVIFVLLQVYLLFFKRHDTLALDVNASDVPSPRVFGENRIGQSFVSPSGGLARIDLLLESAKRTIGNDIGFRLSETVPEKKVVREATIKGPDVKDNLYYPVEFKSLPDSKGRTYEFVLSSSASGFDNSVSVWMNNRDIYPGGSLLFNGAPARGDLAFRVYAKRPIIAEMGRIVSKYPGILGSRFFLAVVIVFFEAAAFVLLRMLLDFLFAGDRSVARPGESQNA